MSAIKLKSVDSFEVQGRGLVYAFNNTGPDRLEYPGNLKGNDVDIDGVLHHVVGVEMFVMYLNNAHPYPPDFGLLVSDTPSPTTSEGGK